jgi:hypothetical protein
LQCRSVDLAKEFSIELGWVSQAMGWVGLGHIKWTNGLLLQAGIELKTISHTTISLISITISIPDLTSVGI